jgi:hypothetical protein
MIAGARLRFEATVWKYAEYFNLTLGDVSVTTRDEDAFAGMTVADMRGLPGGDEASSSDGGGGGGGGGGGEGGGRLGGAAHDASS